VTTYSQSSNGHLPPVPLSAPERGELAAGTAIAALDLLAHWWSRPVAAEVSTWSEAADVELEVRDRMPGTEMARALVPGVEEIPGLLDEYERLFVGPGPVPCPPYESYWREDVPLDVRRSLMGPCTADLRRIYAELGLEMAPGTGELPDHIAVELEALAYAVSDERTYPQARALFFDHLRRWLPRLCRAVDHEAEGRFYHGLAAVTLDWSGPLQRYIGALPDATQGPAEHRPRCP
jgi:TorA maturation chaperone TorD